MQAGAVGGGCRKFGGRHKMLSCDKVESLSQQNSQENGYDTTLSAFEPVLSCIVDGVSGQNTQALSIQ